MVYTVKDIEHAIQEKLVIKASPDLYCIPVRIDEDNKVWGVWYVDESLTNLVLGNKLEFMFLETITEIQRYDTIDILLRRIGYEV